MNPNTQRLSSIEGGHCAVHLRSTGARAAIARAGIQAMALAELQILWLLVGFGGLWYDGIIFNSPHGGDFHPPSQPNRGAYAVHHRYVRLPGLKRTITSSLGLPDGMDSSRGGITSVSQNGHLPVRKWWRLNFSPPESSRQLYSAEPTLLQDDI